MTARRLILAALAATLACRTSSALPETQVPHGDLKTLSTAELATATQTSLLDVIVAQRPQWLKSPDGRPQPIAVYVDDARLGGVSSLSTISVATVASVRYYETTAAQARFGGRDFSPAIQVVSK